MSPPPPPPPPPNPNHLPVRRGGMSLQVSGRAAQPSTAGDFSYCTATTRLSLKHVESPTKLSTYNSLNQKSRGGATTPLATLLRAPMHTYNALYSKDPKTIHKLKVAQLPLGEQGETCKSMEVKSSIVPNLKSCLRTAIQFTGSFFYGLCTMHACQ